MIDLSFTQDPAWIEHRQAQWKPIGKDLKTDLDAKTVGDVEHYFMTGEFRENGRISDGACLAWFPLQNPEGWDYVLQHVVLKQDIFEEDFYRTLLGQEDRLSVQEELDQWDYFHPKVFQGKVISRVPVGRVGERVEVVVNPHRIASLMAMGYLNYLRYGSCGDWPKWCARADYFFCVLPHLSYDKEKKYKKREWPYKAYRKLSSLFDLMIEECRKNRELNDQYRLRFVDMLEEHLESSNNLPEKMIEEWAAAKKRYNYTSKFE